MGLNSPVVKGWVASIVVKEDVTHSVLDGQFDNWLEFFRCLEREPGVARIERCHIHNKFVNATVLVRFDMGERCVIFHPSSLGNVQS